MDELKTIYNMFTDIWKLYRKYYNRLNGDADCEAAIKEVSATNKKYNTQFCREMLVCLMDEFDRLENYNEKNEGRRMKHEHERTGMYRD